MAEFFRSLIVTTKTIATMILHPSLCQIEELLAWMECPNCKYCIDNTDVLSQWPGLPAGVKFDPTDLELLEHLEGKVGRAASHVLIGGFIPTIEEAEGICYTHPENLPGVKLDGIASHFFHKISNAYDVGKRKRRKISHSDHTVCDEILRWHKTGKSRSILDSNGVIKGWKKILVLYIGSRKGGGKTVKTNWRMHQYHLGVDQDEKQEELVVSKVFYQLESNNAGENDPTTPITYLPQPRRPNGSPSTTEQNQEGESRMSTVREAVEWLAGSSSHTVEDAVVSGLDEDLSRGRTPDAACPDPEGQLLPLDAEAPQGFADDLGAPPDISLPPDMQLGSQDSMEMWLASVLTEDDEGFEVAAQQEEAGGWFFS
ncbi:NAC domain-containing protein 73-like isoform X2 [Hordeum vulgare subsp. vulgare]|uniref:NAC domain-containing protein 73-like isoform X2 n=1 Tax=Hordeum vulgare subsp. vulgare TaxID=112509 RepID=UPI001D1A5661|nr:NAC domain-containing protein 73-like isoform X2 [Hordeum vulgare subsp. vulgare]